MHALAVMILRIYYVVPSSSFYNVYNVQTVAGLFSLVEGPGVHVQALMLTQACSLTFASCSRLEASAALPASPSRCSTASSASSSRCTAPKHAQQSAMDLSFCSYKQYCRYLHHFK
jgi:hypothetical protein